MDKKFSFFFLIFYSKVNTNLSTLICPFLCLKRQYFSISARVKQPFTSHCHQKCFKMLFLLSWKAFLCFICVRNISVTQFPIYSQGWRWDYGLKKGSYFVQRIIFFYLYFYYTTEFQLCEAMKACKYSINFFSVSVKRKYVVSCGIFLEYYVKGFLTMSFAS